MARRAETVAGSQILLELSPPVATAFLVIKISRFSGPWLFSRCANTKAALHGSPQDLGWLLSHSKDNTMCSYLMLLYPSILFIFLFLLSSNWVIFLMCWLSGCWKESSFLGGFSALLASCLQQAVG